MEAYLDNSATTRCSEDAKDLMVKLLVQDYGNPSSLHTKGMEAEKYIKTAREQIAKTMKVSEKEIVFTSGGTESNNMAIIGTALANKRRGNHIITTAIEHASVSSPMLFLEEMGFEVTFLKVDHNGIISLEELKEAVTDQTILVSLMYVNNEIGAIEPIREAAEIVKAKNPDTVIHVDAIQAYGKLPIYPKKLGIDMLSVSGHKIHAPKGSGFLYIKEKTRVKPIIYGGGQQKGMRSGTENTPACAGLGLAAKEIYTDFEQKQAKLYELRDYFIQKMTAEVDGVTINGKTNHENAPHIVSVSFDQIRSEVLLHSLEEKNVYVSSGSACSSNRPGISGTLRGIGVKPELLDSTIRFSFSVHTTREELDYAIEQVKTIVPMLRKYIRH